MSQAPTSVQDTDSMRAYREGWKATKKLLREGRSFSGHERNCAFLNCAGGRFANVSSITGWDFDDDGRSVGVTDWDQDGDLDVWIRNRTGPRLRLLRNQTHHEGDSKRRDFVAFRLQGTESNRDAIGARVSVTLAAPTGGDLAPSDLAPSDLAPSDLAPSDPIPSNPTPNDPTPNDPIPSNPITSGSRVLIQTVTAGDAYLSQSSKSLHFGLGTSPAIEQVTVRWPLGEVETFTNIRPGGRYAIVEGTGQADLQPPPTRAILLTDQPQPAQKVPPAARTYFSNRLPVPLLRYQALDSKETRLIQTNSRPLLITLWASWCSPCLVELQAFAQQASSLRDAGLDILALSVDGLDQANSTTPTDAVAALERIAFPFDTGLATGELLRKLIVVEGVLFNHQPGLAVPTSFLLDGDGRLAAIYHGPVEFPQLRRDMQDLRQPLRKRRDLAVPFTGRWLAAPRQLLLRSVARIFRDQGFDEDYARYLQLDTRMTEYQRSLADTDEQRRQLDAQFAAASYDLGLALVAAGDSTEAIEHFRRAIDVQPDHIDSLVNLGALLARSGRSKQAIDYLQRAVDADGTSIPARTNLAAALSSNDRFADAVKQYQAIVTAQPDNAKAHSQLGRCYLELGRVEPGAEHLQQAVRLNPKDFAASLSLAWLWSTSSDKSIRNGEQAVALAERLRSATRGENPLVLDVLAAAYAEQGEYDKASEASEQAIHLVGQRNTPLRQTMVSRNKTYQSERPHRDSDSKYP